MRGILRGDKTVASEFGLVAENVSKSFEGLRAVGNVSIAVPSGSVESVIGPNGAGKTTLFNILSGAILSDSGDVYIAGTRVTHEPPHVRCAVGLSRTFQNLRLFHNLSVQENVELAWRFNSGRALVRGLVPTPGEYKAKREGRRVATELLRRVGLEHSAKRRPQELAYGAQRRLEVARALAGEPAVVLLDEPAAGLNAAEERELSAIIREMRQEGLTVLLIEHNMDFVMGLSDHVTVMNHGEVIFKGAPAEAVSSDVVKEVYLGAR